PRPVARRAGAAFVPLAGHIVERVLGFHAELVHRLTWTWSNKTRTRSSRSTRRAAMAEPRIPAGFDFTDPELCASRVPAAELAERRRAAPVWWQAQPRGSGGFDDDGFWVVTRHADIVEISRSSHLFGTWENTAIIRHVRPVTQESLDMQRLIL